MIQTKKRREVKKKFTRTLINPQSQNETEQTTIHPISKVTIKRQHDKPQQTTDPPIRDQKTDRPTGRQTSEKAGQRNRKEVEKGRGRREVGFALFGCFVCLLDVRRLQFFKEPLILDRHRDFITWIHVFMKFSHHPTHALDMPELLFLV